MKVAQIILAHIPLARTSHEVKVLGKYRFAVHPLRKVRMLGAQQ